MSAQIEYGFTAWDRLRIKADGLAEVIDRAVMWTCAVLLALMTIDILVGVFFRYVLHASIIWSEELARYMMIWAAALAMSSGIKRGEHLAIRFLIDALPPRLALWLDIFLKLLLFGFLAVLVIYGIDLVKSNYDFVSQALEIRMSIPTSAVPVAGVLMLIQLAIVTFHRLTTPISLVEGD